jgi:hypothetical protein
VHRPATVAAEIGAILARTSADTSTPLRRAR